VTLSGTLSPRTPFRISIPKRHAAVGDQSGGVAQILPRWCHTPASWGGTMLGASVRRARVARQTVIDNVKTLEEKFPSQPPSHAGVWAAASGPRRPRRWTSVGRRQPAGRQRRGDLWGMRGGDRRGRGGGGVGWGGGLTDPLRMRGEKGGGSGEPPTLRCSIFLSNLGGGGQGGDSA